jgi:hypothetical protein
MYGDPSKLTVGQVYTDSPYNMNEYDYSDDNDYSNDNDMKDDYYCPIRDNKPTDVIMINSIET